MAGNIDLNLGGVVEGLAKGLDSLFTSDEEKAKARLAMQVGFTGTNSSTLSVTSHETTSPEDFTFNASTDYLVLEWSGSRWCTIHNDGVAT